MTTQTPSELELVNAIKVATENAIRELFKASHEHFYYCSLITDGEAHAPTLTAWSYEALERAIRDESQPEIARLELKWSYADSPYYCYGENYFDEVRNLFSARPNITSDLSDSEWSDEFQLRLGAMERAMDILNKEGFFGVGKERLSIVVNVEVMPPDHSNTERALRLNPPDALSEWLDEAGE